MNVNYEYYKIFYYVAKYSNFTKAAHALGNSQPNITRAMNCLEQQLGCSLFIRNNRGIQLTPEGEKLYTHVSVAMSQLLEAEEELSDSSSLTTGSVSIGASETALNIFLLDKLKKFHIKYPGIRLKIYNHSTPQAIEAVRSGIIKEILVGGTTFTALGSQELSLNELKNYPLICLGRETMTFQFYNELFYKNGIELLPDTEVATTDQILPLVKNELGLGFVPELMAQEALSKREIVKISLKETIPERNVCMVYDYQHPLNSAAKELKKMIMEE